MPRPKKNPKLKRKPEVPSRKTREQAKGAVDKIKKGSTRKPPKVKARGTRTTTKKGKDPSDPKKSKRTPKGKALNNAQKSVRDTLIVERVALGWTWREIAEEAGISVEQTKKNYKDRIEALPKLLEMDPIQIIELLVQGFQSTIIDFERMAQEYADRHPSAAVGAKKGAVEARKDLTHLLQATGQLPNELGTLRHLYDVRITVQHFIAHVDTFMGTVQRIDLPDEKKAEVLEAAGELKSGLRGLAGEDEEEAKAA